MIASRRGFLVGMQRNQNGVKAVRYHPCTAPTSARAQQGMLMIAKLPHAAL
jgi:hypothetical protein